MMVMVMMMMIMMMIIIRIAFTTTISIMMCYHVISTINYYYYYHDGDGDGCMPSCAGGTKVWWCPGRKVLRRGEHFFKAAIHLLKVCVFIHLCCNIHYFNL